MTNFLKETIECLTENNKTESDVLYCVYNGKWFDFEVFKEHANFDYDAGYGGAEAPCVIVVGDNWWLERGEYDGSEWWEFKTIKAKPEQKLEDGADPFERKPRW